jgi:hypothetical protein
MNILTTLTWWGIGGIIATTVLAIVIAALITRKNNGNGASDARKTIGITGAATATLSYTGFYIYTIHVLGVRVMYPSIWGGILIALCFIITMCLRTKDPELVWKPANYKQALTPAGGIVLIVGVTVFCTLNWWTYPTISTSFSPKESKEVTLGQSSRNTLVRSKLIEQNTQHTEGSGETFLGAGSFTVRSDSDFKVYHVWQERDASGVLHVNVAQDGEGKDEKSRDKAVIKDDVPKGSDPYVERVPIYETDPLFVKENNGKLCIKDQDTRCRVNAKHTYDKVIIHVPTGSVIPSVDPNLPISK